MRFSSLLSLSVLSISGCIWQPDSTALQYPYSAEYDVHVVSQRDLDGSEHLIEYVTPSYGDAEVLFVLVNGDTAYRNPDSKRAISIDSSTPFHLDGSRNIVTLVFSSVAISDTSYVSQLKAGVTFPPPGTTLLRSQGTEIGVTSSFDPSYFGLSSDFQITDSIQTFTSSVFLSNGLMMIDSSQLQNFQPGVLWFELSVSEYFSTRSFYYNYEGGRTIYLDRLVAYSLR